eukprot:m.168508 g.168508  ORF g.168508 m.168508 type:complete len:435 (+) comp31522_c1_seq2:28-1332(+)
MSGWNTLLFLLAVLVSINAQSLDYNETPNCHVVADRTINTNPEIWVKIDSLNYILRPQHIHRLPDSKWEESSTNLCVGDVNTSRILRKWLICFVPLEAGEHLITVREEYDSLASSLKNGFITFVAPRQLNPDVDHWSLVARDFACSPFHVKIATAAPRVDHPKHYWRKTASDGQLQQLQPRQSDQQTAEWVIDGGVAQKHTPHYSLLYMVGDSTVQNLCRVMGINETLADIPQKWGHTELLAKCSFVKPKAQTTTEMLTTVVETLIRRYTNTVERHHRKAFVFNEAGLWQAKIFTISSFQEGFPTWLEIVLRLTEYNFDIFWMNTVAVHPIHFRNSLAESSLDEETIRQNWQFTEPRVELINQVALTHVEQYNRAHTTSRIGVVHAWELTAMRDDAPLTPGDMRHYNDHVYAALANEIVATLSSHHEYVGKNIR